MSAIQYLREKAGVFVAIVIALALLLFIIGDLAGTRGSQSKRYKKYYEIGEIAGEKVYYQDFETRVQNLVEIYKLSGVNVDESSYESIRSTVWSQMIKEKILDRHYKDLGIAVSSDELDELVFGDNPHTIIQQLFTDQTTGMFNKSFLVNFLKQTEVDESINNYWLFFEDEIVNDRTYAKYNNLITKGVYVTSKMAEFSKKVNDPTVDFSFVM
ncbi:MAG: SurA N-terminal domain-containing protein [Bacteroidales bacterium]|nr:SurA N-terminal domain-containing protein [Bacteroidales bacterium]